MGCSFDTTICPSFSSLKKIYFSDTARYLREHNMPGCGRGFKDRFCQSFTAVSPSKVCYKTSWLKKKLCWRVRLLAQIPNKYKKEKCHVSVLKGTTHINRQQTDIATYRLNRPRGWFSGNPNSFYLGPLDGFCLSSCYQWHLFLLFRWETTSSMWTASWGTTALGPRAASWWPSWGRRRRATGEPTPWPGTRSGRSSPWASTPTRGTGCGSGGSLRRRRRGRQAPLVTRSSLLTPCLACPEGEQQPWREGELEGGAWWEEAVGAEARWIPPATLTPTVRVTVTPVNLHSWGSRPVLTRPTAVLKSNMINIWMVIGLVFEYIWK